MIKNPPPSPNFLSTLATNPSQLKDIAELNRFIYLLWESLGAGGNFVEDAQLSSALQNNLSGAAIAKINKRLDAIEAQLCIRRSSSDIKKRLDSIEAASSIRSAPQNDDALKLSIVKTSK